MIVILGIALDIKHKSKKKVRGIGRLLFYQQYLQRTTAICLLLSTAAFYLAGVTSSAIQAVNIHLFGLVIYELTLGNYPSLTKQITHALLTGRDATIQLFLSPTPIPQLRIFINTKYHVMA